MKFRITRFAATLSTLALVTPTLVFPQVATNDEIETLLLERVEVYRQAVGIVAAVVTEDGAQVFAVGKTSVDGRAVSGNTIFEIGSISKLFTSLAMADMAEAGFLNMSDPLSKYLPEGVTVPMREGKHIRLMDLATHGSGLPRLPDNIRPRDVNNPYADYTVDDMYAFLSGHELTKDIAYKADYSNYAVGLLGHTLGLVAGQDYETLIKERVCATLKMTDTGIQVTGGRAARFAQGHDPGCQPVVNWDFPSLAGAGGLRSTADDLVLFLRAQMGLDATPLATAMANTQSPRLDSPEANTKVGLGWFVYDDGIHKLLVHSGGTGGYRSWIGFSPGLKRGAVVLANAANEVDDIGRYLLDNRLPLRELEAPREVVNVDPAVFDYYVGTYVLIPTVVFTVTRDGDKLMVGITDQPTLQVFPESDNKFFYTAVDAQISFVRGESGKVTHLILHQFGMKQRADKK